MKDHTAKLLELTGNMKTACQGEILGELAAPVYGRAIDFDPAVKTSSQPLQAENIKQIRTEAEFKSVLARLEPQELDQMYLLCTRKEHLPNGA